MGYKVRCRFEKCNKVYVFDPEKADQVLYKGTSVLRKIFKKEEEEKDNEEVYVTTCPYCKTAKKIRIKKGGDHDREY